MHNYNIMTAMKLHWPLPSTHKRITTQYGEDGHAGIDISCEVGTPVYAALAALGELLEDG